MSSDLSQALGLLLTGMLTVFLILGLVVASGRLLILAVNRRWKQDTRATAPAKGSPRPAATISPEVLAVLTAAVQAATRGQGRIRSVERSSKP